MTELDRAQAWWERTQADLRLRRGQAGRQLLELAGTVGADPERLYRAVTRLAGVLEGWIEDGSAPDWVRRLTRECHRYTKVLALLED